MSRLMMLVIENYVEIFTAATARSLKKEVEKG